eukprot:5385449-Pyramimonas_sp.AAC.1
MRARQHFLSFAGCEEEYLRKRSASKFCEMVLSMLERLPLPSPEFMRILSQERRTPSALPWMRSSATSAVSAIFFNASQISSLCNIRDKIRQDC